MNTPSNHLEVFKAENNNKTLIMDISRSRSEVIEWTVQFEYAVSFFLAKLLGIELNQSVALGDSSSALGFNHKLTLLTDLKVFTEDDKKKFIKLAEIRNKFAHVNHVTTYTGCFNKIDNIQAFFNKYYVKNAKADTELLPYLELYRSKTDEEDRNQILFDILTVDLSKIIQLHIPTVQTRDPKNLKSHQFNSHAQSIIP